MVLGLIACFRCFKGLDFIATIICISFICHLSSEDPFEHYIIGNSSLYFNDSPNTTNITNIIANIEKRNKTNDEELYHFYSNEEEMVQGIKDNSSNIIINKHLFLRRLVSNSFCTKTRLKFDRHKGNYLSNIFKLNIKKIHKISIGLIVVICAPIVIGLLCLLAPACGKDWGLLCASCGYCGIVGSLITNLVLLIILAVSYNKGDIGEYKDFLNCKNVKKKYFDQFSDVIKLSKFIIAFEIFDAIFEVIDTLSEIAEASENKKKLDY